MGDVYGLIGNAFVGTATPYYVEQGHFYLESNNVKDGQINHNSEIFINDVFYEKQKDKWLHTGDIVMVQSGHVGHAAVIPEELDNTAAHALIMFKNPKEEIERYFLNYEYQTDKVVAAKDMTNYYLLKKGEFAYNKSYSNGFDYGSIKRLNAYEQGCLSTLYICFSIHSDEVDSDYLESFFDTLNWYDDVSMICAEGARNHGLLNVDTKAFFTDVRIKLPSQIKEQKKIAAFFNNLDHLITLHQRKCNWLKNLKEYMLKNIFPRYK